MYATVSILGIAGRVNRFALFNVFFFFLSLCASLAFGVM